MNAPQSPTTTHHPSRHYPHFEENSRQNFGGKEVKDNCFMGAHVTEVADECGWKNLPLTDSTFKDLGTKDICTCVGVLESANSQDSTNPTWAGDQSRIREMSEGVGIQISYQEQSCVSTFSGSDDRHERGHVKRRVWIYGITGGGMLKSNTLRTRVFLVADRY
ncbi:hypothetical protein Tco_0150595 [Tanacetum coccineum]